MLLLDLIEVFSSNSIQEKTVCISVKNRCSKHKCLVLALCSALKIGRFSSAPYLFTKHSSPFFFSFLNKLVFNPSVKPTFRGAEFLTS